MKKSWTGCVALPVSIAVALLAGHPRVALGQPFVDKTRPALVIQYPSSGRRLPSSTVTMAGRARDNSGSVEVYVQVNKGAWNLASGSANWRAELELEPGVNFLRAYAVDEAGNFSPTTGVSVTFVQMAPMRVAIVGQGMVAGNYDGKMLEVGRYYSMTAQRANGFVFDHWSGNSGEVSSNSTLRFQMREDLKFTAHFVDRARPVVTISSPRQGQKVFSEDAQFTVWGTARDNSEVTDLRLKINDDDWQSIEPARAWSANVELQPGSNTLQVYAEDGAGNRSFNRTMRFSYVLKSTVTLGIEGVGSVRKSFSGDSLEVGKVYTVIAQPGAGHIFDGWSDGEGNLVSASLAYSFAMKPDLVLQARFIPNPFESYAGSYNGLFYPANDFGEMSPWTTIQNSGGISLTMAVNGSIRGTILTEGNSVPFAAQMATDMTALVEITQPQREPLSLALRISDEEIALTGTLTRGGEWSSYVLTRRRPLHGTPFSGRYSLMIVGCDTGGCFVGPPVPFGDSVGAVLVKPTGALTVVGTLSDANAFSQETYISETGYWPLLLQPYGRKGIVIGWLNMGSFQEANTVVWEKPIRPFDVYYPDGFISPRVAVVAKYIPKLPPTSAMGWTNGHVAISSGNLPAGLLHTNQIKVVNNQIRNLGGAISNLSMSVNPGTGLFQGSFNDPVTGQNTPFKGILVQSSSEFFHTESGGWFLGTNTGGTIRIRPNQEDEEISAAENQGGWSSSISFPSSVQVTDMIFASPDVVAKREQE